ncbi:peptide ABC transporter ATP-binding protein [Azorhizobium oxalatiphilum]|uniref:Peptide ABC transporter ATP-binding protein n=1 Tax=Azorhizobium oxalatiphilum TaxID=980631 RepID=A0A917FBB5_9HYPH|nr:oligopeptide/dipeptide ABC transporter ATP-binding protein [Azorhizobium oxalatiphilum]GGF61656.1 peptide ABC transporter ATP-binding protein [Azorhizobium oxalatiphilum]
MSILSARSLSVRFETPRGTLQAVNDVSLDVNERETVGLVGESGCGKSTLGKALMRLVPAAEGRIFVSGQDITRLGSKAIAAIRSDVQMIFQDPYGSLNPRHTVGKIIGQPLSVAGWKRADIKARVCELVDKVGLPQAALDRFPHEFSGGQRQRIGIARALALNPKVVICDEPVSALDVSVRAQVINLMKDLQAETGVSFLFISHDLSVVEHISDRLLVMYLGRVVESGKAADIWPAPAHPYTAALLAAAPVANPKLARSRTRKTLQGELPSPLNPPQGCAFHTRCPIAQARCHEERPLLRSIEGHAGRQVACHFDLVTHQKTPDLAATETSYVSA